MTVGADLIGQGLAELLRPLVDDAVAKVRVDLEASMRHLKPLAVSATEAGRLIGVSDATVRRLVRRGALPTMPHVGDRLVIPVAALEAFVAGAASASGLSAAS